mmetsp:Transcript_9741/g.37914  ORF Transcript_9741/g.37914 Transcript_9741/m.37914 type:complete len:231 (+) Transcript_9741:871-1563(+)
MARIRSSCSLASFSRPTFSSAMDKSHASVLESGHCATAPCSTLAARSHCWRFSSDLASATRALRLSGISATASSHSAMARAASAVVASVASWQTNTQWNVRATPSPVLERGLAARSSITPSASRRPFSESTSSPCPASARNPASASRAGYMRGIWRSTRHRPAERAGDALSSTTAALYTVAAACAPGRSFHQSMDPSSNSAAPLVLAAHASIASHRRETTPDPKRAAARR